MLTDELIERLRCKGEGSDLDYKAERYPFANATDEAKGEMLKDILAFANAHRESVAYILIGFKENSPHPAEVLGLPTSGALDDARVQQFVNEKLESKLDFRYEERMFEGKQIAVISIAKQPRPFYLKKPYGKLAKETVYIRRGSSTGIASPREIAMMGAANSFRASAKVDLSLTDESNNLLAEEFSLRFLQAEIDQFPDFETPRRVRSPGELTDFIETRRDNSDFWRDAARRVMLVSRMFRLRVRLANSSEFALTGAKLEIHAFGPAKERVDLTLIDDLPRMPPTSFGVYSPPMPHIKPIRTMMEVDDREGFPLCSVRLGTLLPGESAIAVSDLGVLPTAPGSHVLRVRVLAEEINPPIIFEHNFRVHGEFEELDLVELRNLILRPHNNASDA